MTLLVPCEIHFSVPTLTNLGEDMELVELEFRPSLAEEDPFTTLVRGPFLLRLLGRDGSRGDGALECCESLLPRVQVREEIKVMIIEVCLYRQCSLEYPRWMHSHN